MPGTKRKRQKVEAIAADVLGVHDIAPSHGEKDDEECALESFLFGVSVPPKSAKSHGKKAEIQLDTTASGLEHVLDEELFILDAEDGAGAMDHSVSVEEHAHNTAEKDHDDSAYATGSTATVQPATEPFRVGRKPAVWSDPSDSHLSVSLADDKRLRKLRDAPTEDAVNGKIYESKLRRMYETINPVPEWAVNARHKVQKRTKRRGPSSATDSDEDIPEVEDLVKNTNGLVNRSIKSTNLPPGTLAIERLRDGNNAAPSESPISSVRFHPSIAVPVMLTAGSDRRLRIFNIDGLTNPLLQTLHTPDLPPTNAQFHPSGGSILVTGTRSFYYSYDLQSSRAVRSPRGLWHGAAGGDAADSHSLEIARFSIGSNPGSLLAVGGRRGYVHFVDWTSGGGGQVIGSVKMHSPVKDICWVPNSSSAQLMTLGQDAEVYLWDVGSKRCLARWKDEGNFGASVLEGSSSGSHYAIGSSTGIVNVYSGEVAQASTAGGRQSRTAVKTFTNLTTAITSMRFDSTGQVMAISSRAKKDQLRMIHLPSMTTFANWPTSGTPLGTVTAVDFSAGSEYIAVGNTRGKVALYHLRHFAPAF